MEENVVTTSTTVVYTEAHHISPFLQFSPDKGGVPLLGHLPPRARSHMQCPMCSSQLPPLCHSRRASPSFAFHGVLE